MTAPQRGSVLLTVIAGIVILGLIGAAMLTLMTGSVMTGVDGKEAMQATYLAESGKEIVRAQTEKRNGGELMGKAVELDDADENGLSIDGKGLVRLKLFPSWFRWNGDALRTTDSGWYDGPPTGTRQWLTLNRNGAMRYKCDLRKSALDFGDLPADIYLIGRVEGEDGVIYNAENKTLKVKTTTENDLDWFPESGGLIGLVSRPDKDTLPAAVQVSRHRFTYEQKTNDKGTCSFTNVTRLSSEPLTPETFKNKDLALGQYFRVVSTGRTLNDAKAALIWHTNGRESLLSYEKGNTGGSVKTLENVSNPLSGESKELFGENVAGSSVSHFLEKTNGQPLKALSISLNAMCPYHFLLPPKWYGPSSDFWFAGITKNSVYQDAPQELSGGTSDLLYQATVFPHTSATGFFAGILFRTRLLSQTLSNAPGASSGVSGLGLGIVRQTNAADTIADPFLLPGYEFNNAILSGIDFSTYNMYGSFSPNRADHKTFLVLWAYDDSQAPYGTRIPSGPTTLPSNAQGASQHPLRWLAIGALTEKDVPKTTSSYGTTLVARVVSGPQGSDIQAWVRATPTNEYEQTVQWPDTTQEAVQQDTKTNYTKEYRKIEWIAINEAFAAPLWDSNGVITTVTAKNFALSNVLYDRGGIFAGRYKETQPPGWLYFSNFAVGVPSPDGETVSPGLTPGIVQ